MNRMIALKVIFLFLLCHDLQSQNKYWIQNDDKNVIRLLDSIGISPVYCSEWANSCSYYLDAPLKKLIQSNTVISSVLNLSGQANQLDAELLGFALEQINAQVFIDEGLNGSGVKIGVIDGGFLNADKDPSLAHFFSTNKIDYYKDYVTPELRPYGGKLGLDDNHGTEVWQLIGGNDPTKKVQYGLATESQFYLNRTDHGGYEKRIEEDFLLQAIEEMAKKGVRLFNISLGYTEDFDDKNENHTTSEIDGKSATLTKAIDYAAEHLGLLFIIAAGNDGATKWKTLSVPADAKNALTVGASKFQVYDKMNYSSVGPETLNYIKPNISVYATLGTSYAAPIVTGLAACMMQYDSTLSNFEIISILEKSANFYPYGNNYVGYGVPDCHKILGILQGKEYTSLKPKTIYTKKKSIKVRAAMDGKTVVIYHKKNPQIVDHRKFLRPKKNLINIKRPPQITHSTLLIEKSIIEIFWE